MSLKINHFLGGIFLVSGTTIGAGMLATPLSTGIVGLWPSLGLFALCWLVMLLSAFFFLDVNLSLKGEPNMITMAHKTLGPVWKGVSWVIYLLLLYSLIAAYISASTPLFQQAFFKATHYSLSSYLAPFLLPLIFGGFIYFGTEEVDLVNRFLMIGLLVSYLFLITSSSRDININYLSHVNMKALPFSLPIIIASFGYHIIIPSLTTYMKHDRRHLVITIVVGSALSLCVYAIWQVITLGIVPFAELSSSYQEGGTITSVLAKIVQSRWIATFAHFFSFFAIATSFLGVSLSLSDFFIDGFKIKKTIAGRLIALALTFIPPLFFVFNYQKGFILALEYSGAFVAILLIFLPSAMAWKIDTPPFYKKPLGRFLLSAVMMFALIVLLIDIVHHWNI
ncbi:MAG: aromatic amino acid transport family protein [Simkaniaceae bacterium]